MANEKTYNHGITTSGYEASRLQDPYAKFGASTVTRNSAKSVGRQMNARVQSMVDDVSRARKLKAQNDALAKQLREQGVKAGERMMRKANDREAAKIAEAGMKAGNDIMAQRLAESGVRAGNEANARALAENGMRAGNEILAQRMAEEGTKFAEENGINQPAKTSTSRKRRPVIDFSKYTDDRTVSLEENPNGNAIGENTKATDNVGSELAQMPEDRAQRLLNGEDDEHSVARRILGAWGRAKKAISKRGGEEPTEVQQTTVTTTTEPASSGSGNAIDKTPIGGNNQLADNDSNADYSKMDDGLKDLFGRFNGGTGATKEQMQQILSMINGEQSLNKQG